MFRFGVSVFLLACVQALAGPVGETTVEVAPFADWKKFVDRENAGDSLKKVLSAVDASMKKLDNPDEYQKLVDLIRQTHPLYQGLGKDVAQTFTAHVCERIAAHRDPPLPTPTAEQSGRIASLLESHSPDWNDFVAAAQRTAGDLAAEAPRPAAVDGVIAALEARFPTNRDFRKLLNGPKQVFRAENGTQITVSADAESFFHVQTTNPDLYILGNFSLVAGLKDKVELDVRYVYDTNQKGKSVHFMSVLDDRTVKQPSKDVLLACLAGAHKAGPKAMVAFSHMGLTIERQWEAGTSRAVAVAHRTGQRWNFDKLTGKELYEAWKQMLTRPKHASADAEMRAHAPAKGASGDVHL